MSKNLIGSEWKARGNKENGDFEEMKWDQNGKNRWKRKVPTDRAKETGRDLITHGHEDHTEAFGAYPKSKVKPQNDFLVRGVTSWPLWLYCTWRIGRKQGELWRNQLEGWLAKWDGPDNKREGERWEDFRIDAGRTNRTWEITKTAQRCTALTQQRIIWNNKNTWLIQKKT